MKLYYSYMRRLCAYITDRLYQFKRFLQLSIDGLGLSCPVFTKVSGILPVALVCFQFVCLAQESPAGREATGVGEIKPLQIGDSIPEELWSLPLQMINHPDGKDTIALNDYRNKKLIILDFWATWCTSCIAQMERVDSLKHAVGNLAIIPITNESFERVSPFLDRNPIAKKIGLSTVFGGGTLTKYFSYKLIPHYVWIFNDRFYIATRASDINGLTINRLFKTGESGATPKIDLIGYNVNESLLSNVSEGRLVGTTIYSSTFSKKIEGLGSKEGIRKQNGLVRRYFLNRPLRELYRKALGLDYVKLISKFGSIEIDFNELVCYEQTYNENELENANEAMVRDLNTIFNFTLEQIDSLDKTTEIKLYFQ